MADGSAPAKTVRIKSFDLMKGFVIMAIVFIHLALLVNFGSPESTSSATVEAAGSQEFTGSLPLILQVTYSGLMIFFFASGYFFRPGRGFVKNTKIRVVQLAIAILASNLILPLIMYAYLCVLGYSVDINGYWFCVAQLIGKSSVFQPFGTGGPTPPLFDTTTGCYYLQIMLVSFIIFYAVADYAMKDDRRACIIIALLVFCSFLLREYGPCYLPLLGELAPISAAFMLLGALTSKHKLVEWLETRDWKNKKYIIAWISSGAIAMIVGYFFPPGTGFVNSEFGAYGGWSVFPFFIISACTCYFYLTFFTWVVNYRHIAGILTSAGKHTLAILIFHIMIMKMIVAPFFDLNCPYVEIWQFLLIGAADIAICIMIAEYGPKLISEIRNRIRGTAA